MKTFLRKSRILVIVFVIANLFFSNAAFGQATVTEPTVALDQADLDYAPGETVYITGSGWKPGEVVTLEIDNLTTPEVDCGVYNPGPHELWTTVADGNGNFSASWYVNNCELDSSLFLEAYGGESGFTFEIFFTDACNIGNPINPSNASGCMGQNISFSTSVTLNGSPCDNISISYQWQKNGVNISNGLTGNGSTYSGVTTATLTINDVAVGDAATTSNGYSCVLSATGLSSKTTSKASLTITGSSGIYESYAILNLGSGNVFYDLKATTGNTDFQGTNLGTFNSSQTFQLKGAQQKIFKCGSRDITSGGIL